MVTTNVSKPSREQVNAFRTDLFSRTKVSQPYTIFDSSHRYQPSLDYSYTTANGGEVTHNVDQSTILHNVTATSGSEVTSETFRVFPYQAGKSLQVLQTFVFASPKSNLRQRAGYFSRENGIYLEQDDSSVYLVKRTKVSGTVQEVRVPQSEWNIDKLDGFGPSDVVLDLTKAQIFFIEMDSIGIGSVRMGFAIDGYFLVAHQFNHANHIDTVYMTTVTLPVRYEITNTGATDSVSAQKQISTAVISNGGYFKPVRLVNATRALVTVTDDYYPLVSFRMVSGRTDSVIVPDGIELSPTPTTTLAGEEGDQWQWALYKNATITGGTWNTVAPSNNAEANVTATSMSGGELIISSFFSSTNSGLPNLTTTEDRNWALQLGRTNADVPVSDVYTLAARVITGTGTVKGSFSWEDLR
jgi:hypothetical protein